MRFPSMPFLRQTGRAMSYDYARFLEEASRGELPAATYTVKEDGFRIVIKMVDEAVAYFSKSGLRVQVTSTPENIMEAIVWYIHTKYPELTPRNMLWTDDKGRKLPVEDIHLEFVATRNGTVSLQSLFHKECLDSETGLLNERDYGYYLTIFDIVLNSYGGNPPYYQRFDTIVEYFLGRRREGLDACELVEDTESIMHFLESNEGLVFHQKPERWYNSKSVELCYKVKMPKVPLKGRIVAVANTLEDFEGYNLFLVAVPDGDRWSVIHLFDWTEIFEDYRRARSGRVFISKRRVKLLDGILTCDAKSTMAPLVDGVFKAVSSSELYEPISVSSLVALARFEGGQPLTYTIAPNRSFSFTKARFLFPTTAIDCVLGCVEPWLLKHTDAIHLQPAFILSVGEYGHRAFHGVPSYTQLELLKSIARNRKQKPSDVWKPSDIWKMVGMPTGPDLGIDIKDKIKFLAE
jgi:hypothetical protein